MNVTGNINTWRNLCVVYCFRKDKRGRIYLPLTLTLPTAGTRIDRPNSYVSVRPTPVGPGSWVRWASRGPGRPRREPSGCGWAMHDGSGSGFSEWSPRRGSAWPLRPRRLAAFVGAPLASGREATPPVAPLAFAADDRARLAGRPMARCLNDGTWT